MRKRKCVGSPEEWPCTSLQQLVLWRGISHGVPPALMAWTTAAHTGRDTMYRYRYMHMMIIWNIAININLYMIYLHNFRHRFWMSGISVLQKDHRLLSNPVPGTECLGCTALQQRGPGDPKCAGEGPMEPWDVTHIRTKTDMCITLPYMIYNYLHMIHVFICLYMSSIVFICPSKKH